MKKLFFFIFVLFLLAVSISANKFAVQSKGDDIFNVTSFGAMFKLNVTLYNGYYFLGNTPWSNITDKFITAVDNDYIYMDSTTATFNETKQNETIDEKIASVTYNATSISTVYGNLDDGNLASVQTINGNFYNVSEVGGGNSLLIEINFTNVNTFSTMLFRTQYLGGLGHEIIIESWNYNANDWENHGEITDQSTMTEFVVDILDASGHTSGGLVQLRFRHEQNGNPSHDFRIDYVALQEGFTSITGAEHDSLLGRESSDNHPWALPRDGTKNMTGDLNFTSGGISCNVLQDNVSDLCSLVDTTIPGGSNWDVQFNDAGVLGGDSTFIYRETQGRLHVELISLGVSGVSTYETPSADGTANQIIETDGSGTLSWVTPYVDTNETERVDDLNNTKLWVEDQRYNNSVHTVDTDTNLSEEYYLDNEQDDYVLGMNFNKNSEYNSTLTLDSSHHNNHGTIIGAVFNATGGFDGKGAYEFDGVNDYVLVSDDDVLDGNSYMTFGAWVYLDSKTSFPVIMSKWSSWFFGFVSASSQLRFYIGPTAGNYETAVDVLTLNEWHHIVTVYNSTHLVFYVDGMEVDSTTAGTLPSSIPNTATDLSIGYDFERSDFPLNGTIDDVFIFNRSLTSKEIKSIYLQNRSIRDPFVFKKNLFIDSSGNINMNNIGTLDGYEASDLLDTDTNLTGADIVAEVGNWSADEGNYYNITELEDMNTSLRNDLVDTNESDNIEALLAQNVSDAISFYSLNLSGNLTWLDLYNYPSACPADSYITKLGDSVTCTELIDTDTNLTETDVMIFVNGSNVYLNLLSIAEGSLSFFGFDVAFGVGDGTSTVLAFFNSSVYGVISYVDKASNGIAVLGGTSDSSFLGYLGTYISDFGWMGVYGATLTGVRGFLANGSVGVYGSDGGQPGAFAGYFDGTVFINDVLSLNPRSTAPAAIEGYIYSDSDSHALCFYNSTDWIDLTGNGGTCS